MCTIEDIRDTLTDALVESGIDVTPKTLETPLEYLDIDSLDIIRIQLFLQEEYSDKIPNTQMFDKLFYLEKTPENIITEIYNILHPKN